jgi:protein gp37
MERVSGVAEFRYKLIQNYLAMRSGLGHTHSSLRTDAKLASGRDMATTKIEWADAVWNPITGCTPISEACDHCYAKRMATRLAGRYGYPADEPFRVTFHRDRLDEPLRWKKPRRIFVGSMTDIFHPDVTLEWIGKILCITERCQQHTFMFLTKRPELVEYYLFPERDNCWLGVTVENDQHYDRIEHLLQIQAVIKFVSIEPILSAIDISDYLNGYGNGDHISWAVIGQETGPGARPAKSEWFNSIIDQCKSAGVPVFVKKAPAGVPIIREFPTR